MARDKRGYFYRSRRVGAKVLREYYGKGVIADLAEAAVAELKALRAGPADRLAALAAGDAAFRATAAALADAASAHLLAGGYRRHDRGPWRRRRDDD